MRTAIYARKSDDNVAGCAAQLAEARAFAVARGWTVTLELQDNDLSGATDAAAREGLAALLAAVAARQVDAVVTMNCDRLSRGRIATSLDLQYRIVSAGVALWYYQTGQAVQLATATDELKSAIDAYGARDYIDQIRAKTTRALAAQFAAGFAVNSKVYGYRHERRGPKQVVRVIDPAEQAVVTRIFTRFAAGAGCRVIARELNDAGVPGPRAATRGSAARWAASTIRDLVRNEAYLGRFRYGTPPVTWEQPALALIPDGLWAAAQRRIATVTATQLRGTRGHFAGRPLAPRASRYLLSGLLVCGSCGDTMTARVFPKSGSYGWRCRRSLEGRTLCPDYLHVGMKTVDTGVLTALAALLEPEVVTAHLYPLCAQQEPLAARQATLATQLAQLEQELGRLATALAQGGPLETLLAEVRTREGRRAELTRALRQLTQAPAPPPPTDLSAFGRRLEQLAALGWVGLTRQDPARARQVLGRLLAGNRITLTKTPTGLRFEAELTYGPLAAELGLAPQSPARITSSNRPSAAVRPDPLRVVLAGTLRARAA